MRLKLGAYTHVIVTRRLARKKIIAEVRKVVSEIALVGQIVD